MDHEQGLDTGTHWGLGLIRQLVLYAAVHVQGDRVVLLQVGGLRQYDAIRCGS